jgi:SpoVK/Ycf46/Vps4 family AAA+-type ATPase
VFERINSHFNIKDSGTVNFVYGAVNEEAFVVGGNKLGFKKTKIGDLQFLFWNYAVYHGYNILFLKKSHNVYCLDEQSAQCAFRTFQKSQTINLPDDRRPKTRNLLKFQGRDISKVIVDEINDGSDSDIMAHLNPENLFRNILQPEPGNLLKSLASELLTKAVYNNEFKNIFIYLSDFDTLVQESNHETRLLINHALIEFSKQPERGVKFFFELNCLHIEPDLSTFYPDLPALKYFLQLDSGFTKGHSRLDSTLYISTPGKEELTLFVKNFADKNDLVDWDAKFREKIVRFMLSMNQNLKKWIQLFEELLNRRDEPGDFGGISLRSLKFIMKNWSNETNRFGHISLDDREALTKLEQDYAGIDSVFTSLQEMISTYKAGLKNPLLIDGLRRHMAFLGNPGTGKTSVARLVGEVFQEMGLLSRGHFLEVRADDLIAGHVGQTAIKTAEKCKEALGGVLFIDEAYGIAQNDFGKEAIATLLQFMENHRNDLCVIMAGYTNEMKNFFKLNPGLNSRIPESNRLNFKDYSPDQLSEIFQKNLIKRVNGEHNVQPGVFVIGKNVLRKLKQEHSESARDPRIWGNARVAEELVQDLLIEANKRCSQENKNEINILINDFSDQKYERIKKDYLRGKLDDDTAQHLTTLDKIRSMGSEQLTQSIERYIGFLKEFGNSVSDYRPHLVLTGNPGTGKTTLARKLGNLLKEEGILPTGNLVECTRADIIGGGNEHALDKFKEALGGVLFIDEAYSLTEKEDASGRFAVNQLLTFMENYRQETVVVLAGYPKEMRHFMDSNPGLQRRVKEVIEIPDFEPNKLLEIFKQKIAELDTIKLSKNLEEKLPAVFQYMYQFRDENFGNAGTIEKFKNQMLESPRVINKRQELRKNSPESHHQPVELDIDDLPAEFRERLIDTDSSDKIIAIIDKIKSFPGLEDLARYCEELDSEIAFNKLLLNQISEIEIAPQRITFNIEGSSNSEEAIKVLAEFLMALNLIKKGPLDQSVISVTPSALTGTYTGHTIPKVNEFFKNCAGKLLIINGASGFIREEGNSFLNEALQATKENLNKMSERLICVLIDSKPNIDSFLNLDLQMGNIFRRRINLTLPDDEGLLKIVQIKFQQDGKIINDPVLFKEELIKHLEQYKKNNTDLGYFVNYIINRILNNQRRRLIALKQKLGKIDNSELELLTIEDVNL